MICQRVYLRFVIGSDHHQIVTDRNQEVKVAVDAHKAETDQKVDVDVDTTENNKFGHSFIISNIYVLGERFLMESSTVRASKTS